MELDSGTIEVVMLEPKLPASVKVSAVLFDLGGTLHHYKREEVLRALLREKGLDVRVEEIVQAYDAMDPVWSELTADLPQQYSWSDGVFEQMDRLILEHLGVEKDQDSLARFVRQNWDRMDNEIPQHTLRRPYSDALPCLNALQELGMKMGIVSNIPSMEKLTTELERIGLTKFFPMLIASGSIGVAKPDRRIFETATARIGERPRDILFVGDDPTRDYQGAVQSGMKALLIDRRGVFKDWNDLCRISSLEEVPRLLREDPSSAC